MMTHLGFPSGLLRRLGLAFGLAIAAATAPGAGRADVLHWRMNSLLCPQLFGEAGQYFADAVRRMTDGGSVIEVQW